MANPGKKKTSEQLGADSDTFLDDDMDNDELAFEDLEEDDLETDIDLEDDDDGDDGDNRTRSLRFNDRTPSWRRIEIAREDKFLKSAIADFDDYDQLGYSDDALTAEYSR